MEAGRSIRSTRAACHHADAGFAGQPAPGIGHHRSTAFLAADENVDVAVMQRVEHGQETFAGNAGDALDAIGL